MRIANTVFFFPWWGLLLLAVLPPALAAAAAFPLRRFIPDSDAVVDARTKLILLGISAYTFTVAFSVNTLWYQDIELGNSALTFDSSVSVLKDAARDHADDLPADIGDKIEALRQPDVIIEAVSVLPRQNETLVRRGMNSPAGGMNSPVSGPMRQRPWEPTSRRMPATQSGPSWRCPNPPTPPVCRASFS